MFRHSGLGWRNLGFVTAGLGVLICRTVLAACAPNSADVNANSVSDASEQKIDIYVDDDANCGLGDGSPEYPFCTIQEGIDSVTVSEALNAVVTIHVADGTYTGTGNYNIDFGGKSVTVQSDNGPEDCVIDAADQGRGVLFDSGETVGARLIGFTIEGGTGTYGGGIYAVSSSPMICQCEITDNQATYGGGVYIAGGAPTIEDCTITGNTESWLAAGISATASAVTIVDCDISDNNGTAIYIEGGSATISTTSVVGNDVTDMGAIAFVNCSGPVTVFSCLISETSGGPGIYVTRVDASVFTHEITNTTVAHNGADGIIVESGTEVSICNGIVWGNTDDEIVVTSSTLCVEYSDIEGGWDGTGNINANPQFVDPPDDLHLPANSPCIDAGNNDCVTTTGFDKDLDGKPRMMDGDRDGKPIVDMGAYELCDAYHCSDCDPCTCNICDDGTCTFEARTYGDVNCSGSVNVFDVFAIQNAIVYGYYNENLDIHPCAGNGVLNIFDIYAVLNAIQDIDPCCSE